MNFIFPPAPQAVLPIIGHDAVFPVRRVYCVATNYATQALEMGGDGRETPAFFAKPADALVPEGGEVRYPPRGE